MTAERSPDVRRSWRENYFGGSLPDPRGTGRTPRNSARIPANSRQKFFSRANSPYCFNGGDLPPPKMRPPSLAGLAGAVVAPLLHIHKYS